jgi:hypothetical protein
MSNYNKYSNQLYISVLRQYCVIVNAEYYRVVESGLKGLEMALNEMFIILHVVDSQIDEDNR